MKPERLFNLVIFSILSSDIPLDFHEKFLFVSLKYLMYFLSGINTKQFWNSPEEKYFVSLRILYSFVKSFVNSFVDIALTFFDSSFNSFSTSTCFVLFEVTFLFKFFTFPSKFICFTKYHFCLQNFLVLVLQQKYWILQ